MTVDISQNSNRESTVEMTEMVLPQHTNAIGTVFGGTVMSWVDIAAAACAIRHCRCQVVTASIDAMHFLAPIKLGWIVTILASVNSTSRSSCEVGVKVVAQNPLTGERFHTASAYVTMVGVSTDGRPTTIRQFIPKTAVEKRRHTEAQVRRQARLELKEILARQRAAEKNGET